MNTCVKRLTNKYLLYVPAPSHFKQQAYAVPIPKNSILFKDKQYPTCTCGRKYLPKLGCLWCNGIKL